MPLPKPNPEAELLPKLRLAWRACRLDMGDHAWLSGGWVGSMVFALLYTTLAAPYGEALFGTAAAGAGSDGTAVGAASMRTAAAAAACMAA